ncbi:hypothetical protein TcWFU_010019 [Taenia crassiceps]|uniref:DUF5727 domain-containing protein n=1 Tax=Taenia crassiceps TaxID=6207 RepID=A0ABR4Q6K9_9CEST
MYYEFEGEISAYMECNSRSPQMKIEDGKCVVNHTEIWDSPCRIEKNTANITFNNVTAQKSLVIRGGNNNSRLASTTFFVPGCKFPQPAPGKAIDASS